MAVESGAETAVIDEFDAIRAAPNTAMTARDTSESRAQAKPGLTGREFRADVKYVGTQSVYESIMQQVRRFETTARICRCLS